MNHLIFTAVLTACLGIGGYQQGSDFFGPSTEGLGHDPYYDPGQLNSSNTGPWLPLVFPHFTLSIAMYMSAYYILTYFARSFGRFNIHAKVFCWLMTLYPIITALTGFQFASLLSYILQVVLIISGYYNATACFCCPLEHMLSYLLDNFGRAMGKLAVADATAVKKTKIFLADFWAGMKCQQDRGLCSHGADLCKDQA
ncbi:hypothetical protein DSO57_1015842 [Entomophthora muscae]|uniref:Uncharacterized protein n=1 Tax=Entomophthora muscae TaxID=34485 RepID=A0ACC2UET4_9FUNG|nr:hypothetical protein DSO57_1015842 [Entomophthora muscae]